MKRLNDNEVREVARMQQKIDSYEGFIISLYMMTLSDKEINVPKIENTDYDEEMGKIWRWVKERKSSCKQSNKDVNGNDSRI